MSPATGHADTEWFDQFWAECALLGCRFDFLATHFYDARSAENTIKVTQIQSRYVIYIDENHDIALEMPSPLADPVLKFCD